MNNIYLMAKLQQFILLSQWFAIFPYLVKDRPKQKAMKEKARLEYESRTPEENLRLEEARLEEIERRNSDLFWDPPEPTSLWTKVNEALFTVGPMETAPPIVHALAFIMIVYSFYCITKYNEYKKILDLDEKAPSQSESTPLMEPSYELPSFIEESIQLDGCLNPVFFDSISLVFL